ncbi:MAG: hypothetical protein HY974_01735 [Candidatus Kerfeldbacteria bacterium]|nr:hypothetical protein [Candidatus Kerfeldbacteria bacterium]
MHNHGNNNGTGGHNSKMMWFMMLGCLLLVLILTTGGGLFREYPWLVPAGLGALIAIYVWQMFKSNNRPGVASGGVADGNKAVESRAKPHQHSGGCCH